MRMSPTRLTVQLMFQPKGIVAAHAQLSIGRHSHPYRLRGFTHCHRLGQSDRRQLAAPLCGLVTGDTGLLYLAEATAADGLKPTAG